MSTLMMEVILSSEKLLTTFRITRGHNREDKKSTLFTRDTGKNSLKPLIKVIFKVNLIQPKQNDRQKLPFHTNGNRSFVAVYLAADRH
jgi:hypothetical protein